MARYITVEGDKYLIRGNYNARDLRRLFSVFQTKYPTCPMSFREWLNRGHVYLCVNRDNRKGG